MAHDALGDAAEQRFDAKADEVTEELKALGGDIKQRLLNIKNKLG